ncbi:MAG: carbonic anhydrase [Endomicrobiia bacterium]
MKNKTLVNGKNFINKFPKNLVILCSDGRFVNQTMDFVEKKLKIEKKDLMVLPGSVVFLRLKEKNLINRLKLLIEKHNINRIIVFSHTDCGFYKETFKTDPEKIKNIQIEDLNFFKSNIQNLYKNNIKVETYYVDLQENKKVCFIKV